MSNSEKFVQPPISKFDGHYDFWSVTMENFLRSKEMWNLVDEGILVPAISTETTSETQRKSVEESKLKDLLRVQLQALRKKFELLAMGEGEKINNFLGRTLSVVNKMKSNGEEMQQSTIVSKILRSLTPKFNYVMCFLEKQALKTTLDERFVKGRGGRAVCGRGRERGRPFDKSIIECYNCHKMGHFLYECSDLEKQANYVEKNEDEEFLLMSCVELDTDEDDDLLRRLFENRELKLRNGTKMKDLKEKNFALEGERNVLSERVTTLESATTSKEDELTSLSSQVAKLTADLSGLQFSHDELNSNVVSLECVEKMQDEQVRVLSDRVAAIDSDLMEMVLHMDDEFYPRYLTIIAGRRWILSRGLKLVLAKCLSSPEYLSAMGEAIGRAIDKGMQDGLKAGIEHGRARRSIADVDAFNPSAESDYVVAINALQGVSFLLLAQLEDNKDYSMADIMDLLRLEGPASETSEASQLQPSLDQLMILIHRLEDQVIIGETSLAFSLEVAHNRVQRLKGDAAARLLSLTDSILPLVEPLSARNLTGEAGSLTDFTIAVTTALLTTFA
ncbi:reverse transcriptase domain-containing protein [Tanacetum coccineum]